MNLILGFGLRSCTEILVAKIYYGIYIARMVGGGWRGTYPVIYLGVLCSETISHVRLRRVYSWVSSLDMSWRILEPSELSWVA